MSLGVIDHPTVSDPDYTTAILSWGSDKSMWTDGFPWFDFGAFFDGFHVFSRSYGYETTTLLDIYYTCYGLCFVASFFLLRWWQRKGSFKVRKVHLYDMVLVYMIGMLLGAKLGYAAFYNPAYYMENPLQLITNWSGMASHGTVVGVVAAFWIWARAQRVNYWHVMDHLAICAPFGGIFIRSANFANGELFGRPVDESFPLAMRFPMRDEVGRDLYVGTQNDQVYARVTNEHGEPLPTDQYYFIESQAKTKYELKKAPENIWAYKGSVDSKEALPVKLIVKPGTQTDESAGEIIKTSKGETLGVDVEGNFYILNATSEQRQTDQVTEDGTPIINIVRTPFAVPLEDESEIPDAWELRETHHTEYLPLGASDATTKVTAQQIITGPVHPSQLYQGFVTGVVLFIALYLIRRKVKRVGVLFGSFLVLYGGGRILTEFFRQQDPQRSDGLFQYISMGQILSLLMIAAGAAIFLIQRKRGALIAELPTAEELRDQARARAAAKKAASSGSAGGAEAEKSAEGSKPDSKPDEQEQASGDSEESD